MPAVEIALLACALASSLAVRPWRMLACGGGAAPLATPFLAALVTLPWLWAWPVAQYLPVPLQWSGSALAVLVLGWPLAVPVLLVAGLGTVLTADASLAQAISATLWSGVLPATAVLALGHAVRRAFGTHPLAYLLGRAYAVPLAALFACTLGAAWAGGTLAGSAGSTAIVAAFLMALGEAAWTGAIASILVAWRPCWLATWPGERGLRQRNTAGRA